jgi:hypothetical protein
MEATRLTAILVEAITREARGVSLCSPLFERAVHDTRGEAECPRNSDERGVAMKIFLDAPRYVLIRSLYTEPGTCDLRARNRGWRSHEST